MSIDVILEMSEEPRGMLEVWWVYFNIELDLLF